MKWRLIQVLQAAYITTASGILLHEESEIPCFVKILINVAASASYRLSCDIPYLWCARAPVETLNCFSFCQLSRVNQFGVCEGSRLLGSFGFCFHSILDPTAQVLTGSGIGSCVMYDLVELALLCLQIAPGWLDDCCFLHLCVSCKLLSRGYFVP